MTRPSLRAAAAGACALAAAMGIGRFAYTALLPVTQRALGVGDDAAGLLASLNLVGYLGGVLLARQLAAHPRRGALLRAALALTVLATAGGALTSSLAAWAALRALAGLASGLVFVLASAAALEAAPAGAGLLFAGVGAGIALSGTAAALSPAGAGFAPPWLVLAAIAALLAVAPWRRLATAAHVATAPPPAPAAAQPDLGFRRLAAAYFLEGLGYIVSGTFAVAAVRRTPGLESLAAWTWVLTGLAAAPSALLWSRLGGRHGARRVLALAYLVQAVGMALPSLSRSPAAALAGAALFGGTFMGITTLALAAGRALAPAAPGRVIGTLTALYGVGQILGPLLAGVLSERLRDPRPGVLAASGAVALGGILLATSRRPSAAAAVTLLDGKEDSCRT